MNELNKEEKPAVKKQLQDFFSRLVNYSKKPCLEPLNLIGLTFHFIAQKNLAAL